MAMAPSSGLKPQAPAAALLPVGADLAALGMVVLGLLVLYLPTYWDLAHTIWVTDEQGHGPLILGVSLWLMYQRRHALAALPAAPAPRSGIALLTLALLIYVLGRSQSILIFETGSQILALAGVLLLFKGPAAVRMSAFPLFFLIFMMPLPGPLVSALTAPLKSAVSSVAATLMYYLGYPVGRSGVVLSVGQYQLLVADACAGLNSMFTLEALGLLYLNFMRYTSMLRNAALALLLIPISFCANVVRVVVLVLVTYHFGDEAGQGFAHGFAGMVLFLVAIMLMFVVDKLLGLVLPKGSRA